MSGPAVAILIPQPVADHCDPRYFRPAEVELLWGDCTKAETRLGWKRKVDFDGLVKEMVEADVKGKSRCNSYAHLPRLIRVVRVLSGFGEGGEPQLRHSRLYDHVTFILEGRSRACMPLYK